MKTTFKSSELPHVWFHSRAPFGKAPASVSFDGNVYLSYNTAIARKVTNSKGSTAVILNNRSFSNTTAGHQSSVRCAIPSDTQTFNFSDGMGTRLNVQPLELFEYSVNQSTRAQAESDMTRPSMKKDRLAVEAQEWLTQAQMVSDFFGLRLKVDSNTSKKLAAKKAKLAKIAQKAEDERQAKLLEEYTEAFNAWKDGGNDYFPRNSFPVAFRVESDKLVSSLGVRLDLVMAKRCLAILLKARGAGKVSDCMGMKIDGYQIQGINSQGIVAGCHRVTWEELERVSAKLA